MAFCSNCGKPLPENAPFCEHCGAPAGQSIPVPYMQPYVDPADHTSEFDPTDISENKVYAMSAYLLSVVGVLIALLAAPGSKYAAFHARQSLKLQLVTVLVGILSVVLCWTVIVPIAGGICCAILLVIKIICFFQVCSGKAKDAPIVGKLGFLK